MAENEKLDLGYSGSGRWRKWRDSIRAGKSPREVAEEGVRCLAQTMKNLQKRSEEKNGISLKQVLMAATGEDGSFDEIMRNARFGRDYLQLFQSQSDQGLDKRAVVENVLSLIVEKFLGKIGQEIIGESRFSDARSFREFGLSVKDEMIDGILMLQSDEQSRSEKSGRTRAGLGDPESQDDLLWMSVLPDWLRERLGRGRNPAW